MIAFTGFRQSIETLEQFSKRVINWKEGLELSQILSMFHSRMLSKIQAWRWHVAQHVPHHVPQSHAALCSRSWFSALKHRERRIQSHANGRSFNKPRTESVWALYGVTELCLGHRFCWDQTAKTIEQPTSLHVAYLWREISKFNPLFEFWRREPHISILDCTICYYDMSVKF